MHRPPADTITLAQCVVGIAWATLLTLMSSGTGELIIGIYTSIILYSMLRISRSAFNQLTVFAVVSFSVVSLVKILSTEPPMITPAGLVQIMIFTGIMLCLSAIARHVYRKHDRLKADFADLQATFHREHSANSVNSVNRRYILDLLSREKGRTDRSNVPFCVCIFNADYIIASSDNSDEVDKVHALKSIEENIRMVLRNMDSLNSTGFHNCFGAYSDKEFIAILPQTNLAGAQRSAERMLKANAEQCKSIGVKITLCGGISEYHRGETISALLERAEKALDKARTSGADSVCSSNNVQPEVQLAEIVRLETKR